MTSNLRVAVVHDWLTGMRGGEKVLEALLSLHPDADLFTLLHKKGSVSSTIAGRTIRTSFIDSLPFKNRFYRHYLPLFPAAIETFDLHGYDLVISSSHCVAKGVIVPPGTPHICFVHSPMRYVWDMTSDYFPFTRRNGESGGLFNRFIFPFFANYLRTWDSASATRVDRYVTNSAFVRERVRRFYGRDAGVVHPPCIDKKDLRMPRQAREDFYLVVSALVPYKRVDLAVDAFAASGRKLVVVGDGPDYKALKRKEKANIEFAGKVPFAEIQSLYSRAAGLIFPGVEDFGIVPVEAQAHGCPVVAYGRGGALETVTRDTGVFFKEQTADAVARAVEDSAGRKYRPESFTKSAGRFTTENFLAKMKQEIKRLLKSG